MSKLFDQVLRAELLMEASRQAMIDMVTRIFSGLGKMAPLTDGLPSPHPSANGTDHRGSADGASSVLSGGSV